RGRRREHGARLRVPPPTPARSSCLPSARSSSSPPSREENVTKSREWTGLGERRFPAGNRHGAGRAADGPLEPDQPLCSGSSSGISLAHGLGNLVKGSSRP